MAMEMIQQFKKSEAEPYTKSHEKYPENFVGSGKCHLRALWNVSQEAAKEASEENVSYKNINAVMEILLKYKNKEKGQVFHLQKEHWTALERVKGNNDVVYYDGNVMIQLKTANMLQLARWI